jgi:Fic family protein
MPWNWELKNWPHFTCDFDRIKQGEKEFLVAVGKASGCLKSVNEGDTHKFIVEILSIEGIESAKIEGETLDRESLQSSIKRHFGFNAIHKKSGAKEKGMAELLCRAYETFDQPLTHEMLWQWHALLFKGRSDGIEIGEYRTHKEPMQIVSNRYGSLKVFFEAPPSKRMSKEMETFIKWFNDSRKTLSSLERAAIAHIYFESIHPFEDGNGRIGRVLVEKILSQSVGEAVLVAISYVLKKRKKEYYTELQKCNQSLDAADWVEFFSGVILQAQQESIGRIYFILIKSKMLAALSEKLNSRQEKVLLRVFAEGVDGFKGGLSAKNYISIAKCSRA